jgi:hypothetical protein
MQINKDKMWKITVVLMLLGTVGTALWQGSKQTTLMVANKMVQSTTTHVQQLETKLSEVTEKEQIEYINDYVTQSADKVIDTFFKEVRTYNDSASYNTRKERIAKTGLVSDKVLNSGMFKTDKEETGESYIDNTGMSVSYDNAKFYVNTDKDGKLSGRVLVNSTLRNTEYEHESTAIYDVTYDKELGQLVDVKYVYGLLKGGEKEND